MARAAATASHWPVVGAAAVSGGSLSGLCRRRRAPSQVVCAAAPPAPADAPLSSSSSSSSAEGDAATSSPTSHNSSRITTGASAAAAAAGTDSNIDDLIAWFAERRRQEKEGGGRQAAAAGMAAASAQQQQQQQTNAAALEDEGDDPGYMREYATLKTEILDSTRKCGGGLALYALLTAGGVASLCVLCGAAGSSLYVTLLIADVDGVRPTDTVPIWEANRIQSPFLRRLAKIAASYRAALRPRLLVPLGLAMAVAAFNAASPEPLPLVDEGCVLAGFLSYKVALLVRVADAQWPASRRTRGAPVLGGAYRDMVGDADSGGSGGPGGGGGGSGGTLGPNGRPLIERFEDDLDQWGRPKRRVVTMPTAALPPEQRKKAEEQLEEEYERKERRALGGGGAAEAGPGGEGGDPAA
jgi:hypothetical protein